MVAAYRDTSPYLRVYYKDEQLLLKDGPFQMYFPEGVLAVAGSYINNIKQGPWLYYHTNGQKKDSGSYKNNYMVNEWKSYNEHGDLLIIVDYPDRETISDTVRGQTTLREQKTFILAGDTSNGDITGRAIRFYEDGQMRDSGRYIANKETGYWRYFYTDGSVESSGTYKAGYKEGDWEYFREDGTRSTKEKYAKNKIVSLECYDEKGNFSGIGCPIQKPPVAQGPFLDFSQFALNNMYWPEALKDTDITGQVNIEYTITKEGKLINLKVLRSPHPLMSAEVREFFKSLEWSPAVSHNRPVDYKMTFSVPFYR
jgi:TonB family protein